MPELFDVRSTGLDCRAERELVRKIADAENATRAAIERDRRVIAERRAELEAQIAAEEEALPGIKEAALALQEEVACARRDGGLEAQGVVDVWPQLAEAAEAAQEARAELDLVRQRRLQEAEDKHQRLQVDRGVFQLCTAATGVHWDHDSQHVEGYVALASARHFRQPRPASDDPAAKAEMTEAIWEEIEKCLAPPAGASADRPPWEAVPGGA